MRILCNLLLLAGLVLATACDTRHDNLLPPVEVSRTWVSQVTHGSGPAAVTETNFITLQENGEFSWSRGTRGDGVSNPDAQRNQIISAGQYRIRDGFLDLYVVRMASVTPAGVVHPLEVDGSRWTGDLYRILAIDDLRLMLRFIPAESSSRTPITLEFQRVRPVD